jgi:death-on-curing protein
MTKSQAVVWLTRAQVEAFNDDQLREHGGLAGLRDGEALEAALARPLNMNLYDRADLYTLATAYAHGIVKNHPFMDGNKRTAFAAAAVFLDLNGIELMLDEKESASLIRNLAISRIQPKAFAEILGANSRKMKGRQRISKRKS